MGVSYIPNIGIGVEIYAPDVNEEFFDIEEWLDFTLEGTYYKHISTGNGLCDDEFTYYIVLKDPFEDGFDLTEKVNQLLKFLSIKNISFKNEVGLVGGLLIL